MNKMRLAKEVFDQIPVPGELNQAVLEAIRQTEDKNKRTEEIPDGKNSKSARRVNGRNQMQRNQEDRKKGKRKNRNRSGWKKGGMAAAAAAVIFMVGINTSETFAKELQEIPVIGHIVKVLTIRSYDKETENAKISVEIPAIEAIREDTKGLAEEVNQQIRGLCEAYAEEAEKRAFEYRQAFLETGGTEEEWAEHDIEIRVWYEILSQTPESLSFVILGTESWTSAYAQSQYYNLDLENNQYITLSDVLGEDYIQIANQSIIGQMKTDSRADEFWSPEEGGFESIDDSTKFYLNKDGNPVIVFEKYEIGPGSLGEVEFVIGTGDVTEAAEGSVGKSEPSEEDKNREELIEDNFSADLADVKAYGEQIQKAVAEKDLEALAALTAYPVYIGFPDGGMVVETREDFLALDSEKLFTDKMLQSIAETDLEGLSPSMAGFTLAETQDEKVPTITFGVVEGKFG